MKLGHFEVFVLSEGVMQVDGGAVFGPVPRVRWERRVSPDEQNRVVLGLNQLLVRGEGFNLLVDTGFGTKMDERTHFLYGIKRTTNIEENLAAHGLKPADITHVVLTHLHNDHVGGATTFNADRSQVHPTFPEAEYYIHEGEWRDACSPNEFNRVSYLFENYLPLSSEGKLRLLKNDQEIVDGVRVMLTGGHTRFHQMVRLESAQRKLFFPGDLIPTALHLPIGWHSAVDLCPLDLLEAKRRFLDTVLNMETLVVFSHEPNGGVYRITGSHGNPQAIEIRP